MLLDCFRLALGLGIALFHAPLADFVWHQDCALSSALRQRGLPLPMVFGRRACQDIFFALGITTALISLVRLWLTMH